MLISPMEHSPPHTLAQPSSSLPPSSLPPSSPPLSVGNPPSPARSPSPPSSPPSLTRRHTVALPSPSPFAPFPPSSQPRITELRNPSLSAPALAPLDFSTLCSDPSSSSGAGQPPCTARRNINAITSSLSRLRPFLFVTSAHGARSLVSLRESSITHIINVAGATSNNFFASNPAFSYLRLCPKDDATEDISVLLDHTTAFIDAARTSSAQSRIAVHCHMGVSRSATVAAAYLIMSEGLTFDAAIAELRHSRPIADPNPSFSRALSALAARVRDGRKRPQLFRVQPHPLTTVTTDDGSLQPFLVAAPVRRGGEEGGDDDVAYPPMSSADFWVMGGAHVRMRPPHILREALRLPGFSRSMKSAMKQCSLSQVWALATCSMPVQLQSMGEKFGALTL